MSRTRAALRRAATLAPAVVVVTTALLLVRGVAPAPAHAIDLFPIDDWIGDGLKSVGKIVLGPLKLTAEGIAHLLGAIVAALADLLIPKSLIKAGLGAIKWLVELPPLGSSPTAPSAVPSASMPHLKQLRDTLTWIGLTLLPLQIVLAGGRAFLSPTADGDSPAEVLQRTIAAAIGLVAFDWLWGALTELVRLITTSLLSLPWVADGVRRMLQSLVIGGASGTAVASEFVVPLILTVAGAVLLALMLLRVALEVIASIVYATGGLALGLSVSGAGHRLLQAWLVAAAAVFVLPVLWCIVFVTGAAIMVDAGTSGQGGFGDFVGQLYNIGAALVTFGIAIKIARATLGHAGTAITGLATTARLSGASTFRGRGPAPQPSAGAARTPQSLARFSQQLRGGMRGATVGVARVGAFPIRHPAQAVAQARHPVQATRDAAEHLRSSSRDGAAAARRGRPTPGAGGAGDRRGPSSGPSRSTTSYASPSAARRDQPPGPNRQTKTRPRPDRRVQAPPSQTKTGSPSRASGVPPSGRPVVDRRAAGGPAPHVPTADTSPTRPAAQTGPRPTTSSSTARAWKATRRVVAPKQSSKSRRKAPPKRKRNRP